MPDLQKSIDELVFVKLAYLNVRWLEYHDHRLVHQKPVRYSFFGKVMRSFDQILVST